MSESYQECLDIMNQQKAQLWGLTKRQKRWLFYGSLGGAGLYFLYKAYRWSSTQVVLLPVVLEHTWRETFCSVQLSSAYPTQVSLLNVVTSSAYLVVPKWWPTQLVNLQLYDLSEDFATLLKPARWMGSCKVKFHCHASLFLANAWECSE